MIYGASFSWNSNQLSFDEINKQISFLEYKDSSGSLVQIINEIASEDNSLWSFLVEYKEKKQKKIRKEIVVQAYQANDKLEKAVEKMYHNMIHMESAVRSVVKAYLIMAKGLILFYTVLVTLYEKIHKKDSIHQELIVDPLTLASNLEYWFMDYKKLWRSQSKEGELYRIQEIVFWYADCLRSLD
jgi:HEPN domain-containing protein